MAAIGECGCELVEQKDGTLVVTLQHATGKTFELMNYT